MKKLLLFFIIYSLTATIYPSVENLKQAIIKSDVTLVKDILKTTKLSKQEIATLSDAAENTIHRRMFDEKIAYIPEIFFGFWGLYSGTIATICFLAQTLQPTNTDLGGLSVILGTTSLGLLSLTYQIFKLTHKWHDDAIEIKQLIASGTT